MFCKHCGASVSDDADFCESCGRPLATQHYHTRKNVKVMHYKKLDRKRIMLIAGVAAAVLILLGIFLLTGKKKQEKKTSNGVVLPESGATITDAPEKEATGNDAPEAGNGEERGTEEVSPEEKPAEDQPGQGNAGSGKKRDQSESVNNKTQAEEKAERERLRIEGLTDEEKTDLGIYLEQYASCAADSGISLTYLKYTVTDLDGNGTDDFCVLYSYENRNSYGLRFWTSDKEGKILEGNEVLGISVDKLNEAGGLGVSDFSAENILLYPGGVLDLTGTGEYLVTVNREEIAFGETTVQAGGHVVGLPYSPAPGVYRVISIDKKGEITVLGDDQSLYEGLAGILKGNGSKEAVTISWKDF